MRLLLFLVYGFVQTFGITQPTPAGARRAARALGWLLLGLVPVVLWLAAILSRMLKAK